MKRRIHSLDLIRMSVRSLLVQGSWNYKSMLGLGFCYSIMPVIRIFKTEQDRAAFVQRHLGFFNAHPYLAGSLRDPADIDVDQIDCRQKHKEDHGGDDDHDRPVRMTRFGVAVFGGICTRVDIKTICFSKLPMPIEIKVSGV